MRIDNAFSYMMDRRAGSSKVGTPPRYDADDCHEYVPSTICKLHLLTHLPSCQIPGYSQRVFFSKPCNFFSYLMRNFLSVRIYRVQGETEGDFRRGDKRCVIRNLLT